MSYAAYTHDCGTDRWIGTIAHHNPEASPVDLYLCADGQLLARYGSGEGRTSDKVTLEQAAEGDVPELVLAADLVLMQGLA